MNHMTLRIPFGGHATHGYVQKYGLRLTDIWLQRLDLILYCNMVEGVNVVPFTGFHPARISRIHYVPVQIYVTIMNQYM